MSIVKFYRGDPKNAPKTTMPAHLGANAIITCNGKILLEIILDTLMCILITKTQKVVLGFTQI